MQQCKLSESRRMLGKRDSNGPDFRQRLHAKLQILFSNLRQTQTAGLDRAVTIGTDGKTNGAEISGNYQCKPR